MTVTSSVVVVSYRPGTWLTECLASVLPQTDEVILVDNGSAAEEASAIGRQIGVKVVRATENLGFAGGVNLGLAHTSGEIVGLLNDDATAGPGWLKVAAEALADPTVTAVTPKVVLNSLFAEVVLDDDPWFAAGDARPLGRQVRSLTAGGTEVLDALGGGLHDMRAVTSTVSRRNGGGRRGAARSMSPLPIRLRRCASTASPSPCATWAGCSTTPARS